MKPLKRITLLVSLAIALAGLAACSGAVRYSSHRTVRPGGYGYYGSRPYVYRNGYYDRHVYVPGGYVRAPRHGAVWVPGYWQPRSGGRIWISGYWR